MPYIDKDALIKAVDNLHDCYNGFSDTYDKACFIGLIEEQPTAYVVDKERYDRLLENSTIIADALNKYQAADVAERKKGKWIAGKVKHIKNGELRNMRECSECGACYFVYDAYNCIDEIPKFCPNCGADMRGEDNAHDL